MGKGRGERQRAASPKGSESRRGKEKSDDNSAWPLYSAEEVDGFLRRKEKDIIDDKSIFLMFFFTVDNTVCAPQWPATRKLE